MTRLALLVNFVFLIYLLTPGRFTGLDVGLGNVLVFCGWIEFLRNFVFNMYLIVFFFIVTNMS